MASDTHLQAYKMMFVRFFVCLADNLEQHNNLIFSNMCDKIGYLTTFGKKSASSRFFFVTLQSRK